MTEVVNIPATEIKPTADRPIHLPLLEILEGKIASGMWRHIDPVPLVRSRQEWLPLDANEVAAAAFLHNLSVPAVIKTVEQTVLNNILNQRARAKALGNSTIQDWLVNSLGDDRYLEKMRILHL